MEWLALLRVDILRSAVLRAHKPAHAWLCAGHSHDEPAGLTPERLPIEGQAGSSPSRRHPSCHKRQFVALASIRSLLEVKRTCRDRGRRIDPTRLTLSRHTPN